MEHFKLLIEQDKAIKELESQVDEKDKKIEELELAIKELTLSYIYKMEMSNIYEDMLKGIFDKTCLRSELEQSILKLDEKKIILLTNVMSKFALNETEFLKYVNDVSTEIIQNVNENIEEIRRSVDN